MDNDQDSIPEEAGTDPSEGTPFPMDEPEPSVGLEDDIRRLATEERPDDVPPAERSEAFEAENEPQDDDSSDEQELEGAEASAATSAEAGSGEPPTEEAQKSRTSRSNTGSADNLGEAHASFVEAARAHASALGIEHIVQQSYHQFKHGGSGQKVYVARAVKTQLVHIETTMNLVADPELVTRFGARPPKKKNGKIRAVLDPRVDEQDVVIELIKMLAADRFGQVPPPERKAEKAT